MELGVAAEAGFERGVEEGVTFAVAVDLLEALDTLTVAELDDVGAGLFFEEAAEARGAKADGGGEAREAVFGGGVADESGGALDGGMELTDGNVGGGLEAGPCMKKGVAQAGVPEADLAGGGELGEEVFKTREIARVEAAAGLAGEVALEQGAGGRVDGAGADGAAAEDGDPPFEVGCLLDEDVFLRGEEPEEVAAADLVAAVAEEVGAATAGDEVELELDVMVAAIGGGEVGIAPDVAVECGRELEALQHVDKKR